MTRRDGSLSHREMVVTGKLQVHHTGRIDGIGAHPLGRELAPFSWTHIPPLGVINRNLGPPGIGRTINPKATKESAVVIEFRGRYLLPPIVKPSRGIVGHPVP